MMLDTSDSTWKMHQYSLTDTLLLIGSFKDVQLTVPHGKFTFFKESPPHTQREYNNKSNQIENVVTPRKYWLDMTGDYVNGQKEGEWTKYDSKGGLETTTTWKNDKKNGLYRTYGYDSQKIRFEGNYVNGTREGVWITFTASGGILAEETYKNDQITRKVDHLNKLDLAEKVNDSKPPSDFRRNLSGELKKIHFGNVDGHITLIFKITKEGHLVCKNFYGMERFADKTILTIINAITNSPLWKPASKNGEAVEQDFPIYIEVPSLEIKMGLSSNGKNFMGRFDAIRH